MTNNNTFQDFLDTYNELKNEFYTIFETGDPDAATLSTELQMKLLEFINHTFFPLVESSNNPELFFQRLKSLRYGENKPLFLNYLSKYGLLKSLRDGTKVDCEMIQEAKNKIQFQIQEYRKRIYESGRVENVTESIRNHHKYENSKTLRFR